MKSTVSRSSPGRSAIAQTRASQSGQASLMKTTTSWRGGLFHAPNRAKMRAEILKKRGATRLSNESFTKDLKITRLNWSVFQWMPNYYHLVLRPLVDGEMSRLMGRAGGTHTMRYHVHHHTSGMGQFYGDVPFLVETVDGLTVENVGDWIWVCNKLARC